MIKGFVYSTLSLIMAFNFGYAQEYATTKIPSELRKNAVMVIRDEQTTIKIVSKTKLTETTKLVFTILNKLGDNYSSAYQFYDKNTSLSNLKVVVYDSLGTKTNDYAKNDFKDQSRISGGTIYQDDRIKYLDINRTQYPYTIEFSYTKELNSNFFIPNWRPLYTYNISVEKSNFKIVYPKILPLRFKESSLVNVEALEEAQNITRIYNCQKLGAIEHEDLSTGIENITPWAYFAPNDFSFEDTDGSLATWKDLGSWVYNLSKDGDKLPPAMVLKAHELTDSIKNPKEKARALYHYMQSKTRYVSVQLGIGGFKPFPAEKVALNNYGDCKALSNYMKALLKEVNIPSHLVVVKSGDNKNIWSDFSSMGQADHMILCVPIVKDTVWLECTSQKAPFNYLGSFTENRNVVLVKENGGELVKTPTSTPRQNFQFRTATIKLNAEGDASVSIKTNFGGEQFEDISYQLYEEPKEQKDNLYKSIGIPNTEIIGFSYSQKNKDLPELEETINVKAAKMMNGLGSNLFLTLNLLNRRQYIPAVYENRKTNFAINYSYFDKDEITYEIPEGFKVDFIPENQEIKSEFGIYKIQVKKEGNKITYTREHEMWKKVYEPTKYASLINYYKAIYKADKQKAVIVKL